MYDSIMELFNVRLTFRKHSFVANATDERTSIWHQVDATDEAAAQ